MFQQLAYFTIFKGRGGSSPAPSPVALDACRSALQTRLEVGSVYGLTPFVGREAEVILLQERCTYVQESLGQVVLVQGEAGVGKSRLVQRLKEQGGDELLLALECHCSPYHQNTALFPIIDLVQRVVQAQSVASPADPA